MSHAIPEKYRDLFSKRAFASLGTLMPAVGRGQTSGEAACGAERSGRVPPPKVHNG